MDYFQTNCSGESNSTVINCEISNSEDYCLIDDEEDIKVGPNEPEFIFTDDNGDKASNKLWAILGFPPKFKSLIKITGNELLSNKSAHWEIVLINNWRFCSAFIKLI